MKQKTIDLARSADRKLSRGINKLNKQEHATSSRNVPLVINADMSKDELLKLARNYDIAVYYSNSRPPKNYGYRIAKKAYRHSKRGAVRGLKLGYHGLRRVKRLH